jgi:SAM-dependent MidA family methyltransferase
MDSSRAPSRPPVSPAFAEAFSSRAAGGWLSFEGFMDLCLYHPDLGYYRRRAPRVGRSPDTDFYTSSSSAPVFGLLVAGACATLLGDAAADHVFVEIGNEPGKSILEGVDHGFASTRDLRLGDPIDLPEKAVVFSNELFDAQPLRRFVVRDGVWREGGVVLDPEGTLAETDGPICREPWLPHPPAEGYRLDAPRAAVGLLRSLAQPSWSGLFLAADYGKTWPELATETPQGTLRAYHRHRQEPDLYARPGEQDLTGHVCWDWLSDALLETGFRSPTLEFQEAFLVHRAGSTIERVLAEEMRHPGLSPRRQSLLHLLHPAHLGQKFQVLWARR